MARRVTRTTGSSSAPSAALSAAAPPSGEVRVGFAPQSCFRCCAASFAVTMSLVFVAALGMIAGSSMWLAESVQKLNSGDHYFTVRACSLASGSVDGLVELCSA